MKHFFTTKIRVVLLIAVLLAVTLTIVTSLTGLNIPEMAVKGLLAPIRTGASKLFDGAEQLYNYIFEYEAIAAENEALKQELSQIRSEARKADAIEKENERLRDMLELTTDHADYKLVDGYVISWSSGDWNSTFTIDKGKNAGIEPNMCVITANHELVGLVSEVGPNYAVVKTVLDSSLKISATIPASNNNGMVVGGYSSGLAGLLRMNYLPTSARIRINDEVVTTGSTIYPRDLILGKVVNFGFDGAGVAKYALIEPATQVGSLEQVFVITQYNAG